MQFVSKTRCLLALTLLPLLATSTSFATSKTTLSSCTKLGTFKVIAGIKYVCTKSSSTFVWKVPIKKITTTPTPFITPKPLPTFDYDTELSKVIEARYQLMAPNVKPFLDSIPEFKTIMAGILPKSIFDQNSGVLRGADSVSLSYIKSYFLNPYWNSEYFRSTSKAAILLDIYRTSFPCDYIKFYNETNAYILNYTKTNNLRIPNLGTPENCDHLHAFASSGSQRIPPADDIMQLDLSWWIVNRSSFLQDMFTKNGYLIFTIQPGTCPTCSNLADEGWWTLANLPIYLKSVLTPDKLPVNSYLNIRYDPLVLPNKDDPTISE